MPTFTALNGRELKEVILKKVGEALDDTGEFVQGLTFPWVKYDFKVNVVSYPKQAMDAETGVVAKGEEVFPPGELAPLAIDDPNTKIIMVEDVVVIDTPDKARVDAEIPIPVPAPGSDGVIVDKPLMVTMIKKVK